MGSDQTPFGYWIEDIAESSFHLGPISDRDRSIFNEHGVKFVELYASPSPSHVKDGTELDPEAIADAVIERVVNLDMNIWKDEAHHGK